MVPGMVSQRCFCCGTGWIYNEAYWCSRSSVWPSVILATQKWPAQNAFFGSYRGNLSGAAASVTSVPQVVPAPRVYLFREVRDASADSVAFEHRLGTGFKNGLRRWGNQVLAYSDAYEAVQGDSTINTSFGSSTIFRATFSTTMLVDPFQHSEAAEKQEIPHGDRNDSDDCEGGSKWNYQTSCASDVEKDVIGAVKVARKPSGALPADSSTVQSTEQLRPLDEVGQTPKRSRIVRGRPPLLTATPAAINRIKELVVLHNSQQEQRRLQQRAVGIRISLEKQGCSGMSYQVSLCYEPTTHLQSTASTGHEAGEATAVKLKSSTPPVQTTSVSVRPGRPALRGDEIVFTNGVEIRVAPEAVGFVLGTVVDFVDEETQTGFVFKNPNQKQSCGCGKSFMV